MNQCNNIIENLSKDKWHLQTFKRRVLETKWYLKSRRWFNGESVAEQNELHKWQWENCPMRQKWYWKLKLESIPEVDDEEEPEEDEEEFEYSEEFPDTKDQSSTNRPVSHGPNTPGCLLFKHPQLSNTERWIWPPRVWMGRWMMMALKTADHRGHREQANLRRRQE